MSKRCNACMNFNYEKNMCGIGLDTFSPTCSQFSADDLAEEIDDLESALKAFEEKWDISVEENEG